MRYLIPVLFALLVTNSASAETTAKLDYRHEYKSESKTSSDRLKTYISTDSILWELEARTSNENSNLLGEQTVSSYDIGIFLPLKYDSNLVILPGFDYILTTNNRQYIPSLRVNYKTDNGIRLQSRYKQIINSKTEIGQDDQSHVQRIDFWLGYGTKAWDYQYQISFGKEVNNNQVLQDNKDTDYWQNIRIRYQDNENWKPYFELGDVKVSKFNDKRQLRYRIGLLYAF